MAGMADKPDGYFGLAIVDPPYGIDIADWDTKEHKPTEEYFTELFRVSQKQIIWGANYFNLPHSEAWICWDKTMKSGKMALGKGFKSEFELAWTNTDNKATMLHLTHDGNIQGFNGGSVIYNYKSIHPTQKPVALYEWILKNYAKKGDKILDTHVGSGSSRIAAYKCGFNFTGFEIDPEYYALQEARFREFVMNIAPADLEPVTRHGQIKLF
jgi:site-specific DNA-methyltransferase (adenine-specific)